MCTCVGVSVCADITEACTVHVLVCISLNSVRVYIVRLVAPCTIQPTVAIGMYCTENLPLTSVVLQSACVCARVCVCVCVCVQCLAEAV